MNGLKLVARLREMGHQRTPIVTMELIRSSMAEESQKAVIDRRMASLTNREKQVFVALYEGQSNKEIAQSLDISPRTVEIYRANVMSKMQADGLSELIKMMIMSQAV